MATLPTRREGVGRRLSCALARKLLRLSILQINAIFFPLAVVLSEIVVWVVDWSWDGQISLELQFAGIITPLIVATCVLGILNVLLTALHREANKRRTIERSLNEAQRIAHIGNWVLDLRSNQLTWSAETYRIFEIDPVRFKASYEAFLERVHSDDREAVDTAFRHSLGNRTPYDITHRLLMADKSVKYVHERGETFYDEEGVPQQTIGTIQDVSERVRLEQELKRRANTDPLTGLFNRYRFDESIRRHVYTSQRYDIPLSLLVLDIDRFKRINDTYGHAMGDRVLVHLAEVTRSVIRKSDIFSRWGGEEFLILAPHTRLPTAKQLGERVRAAIEGAPYRDVTVTVSIGVTQYHAGESDESLIKRADEALYGAKLAGRNRVMSKPFDIAPADGQRPSV